MLRAEVYGFLSRMFLEPPPKILIEDIINGSFFETFSHLILNNKIKEGLEVIKEYAQKYNSVDSLYANVEDEYIRLFVGPFNPDILLYESECSNNIETLLKIKQFYRKAGLKKSDNFKEREDHLAIQFEFMRLLCEKNDISLQKKFFNHLYNWARPLLKKIIKCENARFYKGISLIALGFLESEYNIING